MKKLSLFVAFAMLIAFSACNKKAETTVQEGAENAVEQVEKAAGEVGNTIEEGAEAVQDAVGEGIEAVGEKVEEITE